MPHSSEIVPVETKEIAKGVARLLSKSEEIVAIALRAPDLVRTKDGPIERPPGMSDREWNICRDALVSARNVPFYLSQAARMAELSQKIEGGLGDEKAPKATFVMVQQVNYARKDVTADRGDVIDVDVNGK